MDPSSDIIVEVRNWVMPLLEVLKVGVFRLFPISTLNF